MNTFVNYSLSALVHFFIANTAFGSSAILILGTTLTFFRPKAVSWVVYVTIVIPIVTGLLILLFYETTLITCPYPIKFVLADFITMYVEGLGYVHATYFSFSYGGASLKKLMEDSNKPFKNPRVLFVLDVCSDNMEQLLNSALNDPKLMFMGLLYTVKWYLTHSSLVLGPLVKEVLGVILFYSTSAGLGLFIVISLRGYLYLQLFGKKDKEKQ